ncbi:MAG TPA: sugar ABC transporter ATP-binding protein [Clostridiaceae bacterium]|nr:sugar ABC transporter ATP-binding protein [Clostridiaceae bacterium]
MKTLEVKELTKYFGKNCVLNNVNITFLPGEIHAIVGENGAGKSTLLKILMGQFPFDGGSISYNNKKMIFRSPFDAKENSFGLVYQELTLIREMSVLDNLFLGSEYTKHGFISRKKQIEKFDFLKEKFQFDISHDEPVKNLSLSKQYLVEVLRVLMEDSEVIMFDETTSALDDDEAESLFDIIRMLKDSNKIIIFISHRLNEIFAISDKITVLKDGELVNTLFTDTLTHDSLIELMVGRTIKDIYPAKIKPRDEIDFSVEGLTTKDLSLQNISFDVRRGEIVGIAGLKGHGQNILLDCIAGIRKYDTGKIKLENHLIPRGNVRKAVKNGIFLVPEDRKTEALFLNHSVGRNLTISILNNRYLYKVINKKRETNFINDSVCEMNIKCSSYKNMVSELSGGNQQKVVLGKVLGTEPKVLLFNEPTRGIDVNTKQEIMMRIRTLSDEGVSVIIYSSDLLEIIGISNTVYTMYEGRITRKLTDEQINEIEIMQGIHSGGEMR